MYDSRIQVKLLLTLSTFDEIYGPKVVYTYPETDIPFLNVIHTITPHFMDIDLAEFKVQPFIYADEVFIAVNQGYYLFNRTTRGQKKEYLISIIASPADPRALIALSGLKTLMPALTTACFDEPNKIEDIFTKFYPEILNFFRTQLNAWGYSTVDIRDFQ